MTTPTRRRTVALTLAALGIAFTAACTTDEPAARPAAAVVPSAPAAPAPTTPAPSSPAAASKKPGNLKLGEKQRVTRDGYVVEVAALKVKHGDDYEGVQVRVCNKADEVNVSRNPWTLGYDDFEQLHEIDVSGGGLPAPAFEDRDLAEGDCAKGWVNFESVPGEKPDGIQYQPEGAEPVRWSF